MHVFACVMSKSKRKIECHLRVFCLRVHLHGVMGSAGVMRASMFVWECLYECVMSVYGCVCVLYLCP